MKKKKKTKSLVKSGSISALVEEYTDLILQKKKTKANPQKFLERFTGQGREDEFKTHINMATLLTMQGLAMQKRAEKLIKNTKRIERAKKEFLESLKKSGEGQQSL